MPIFSIPENDQNLLFLFVTWGTLSKGSDDSEQTNESKKDSC